MTVSGDFTVALLDLVSLITVAFPRQHSRRRQRWNSASASSKFEHENNAAARCGEGESMPVPSFYSLQQDKICKQEQDRAVIDQQARLFFVE